MPDMKRFFILFRLNTSGDTEEAKIEENEDEQETLLSL